MRKNKAYIYNVLNPIGYLIAIVFTIIAVPISMFIEQTVQEMIKDAWKPVLRNKIFFSARKWLIFLRVFIEIDYKQNQP